MKKLINYFLFLIKLKFYPINISIKKQIKNLTFKTLNFFYFNLNKMSYLLLINEDIIDKILPFLLYNNFKLLRQVNKFFYQNCHIKKFLKLHDISTEYHLELRIRFKNKEQLFSYCNEKYLTSLYVDIYSDKYCNYQDELKHWRRNKYNSIDRVPNPDIKITKLQNHIFIQEIIKYFNRLYNLTPIILKKDQIINSYNLYDTVGNWFNIFELSYLFKLFNDKTVYTFIEFYNKFDENACTTWNKMNKNGEYYSSSDSDSDDKLESNSWENKRRINARALYELQYSHKLLLYTVNYGCNTGNESVKYSNCMCYWIEQKINMLNNF